MNGWLVVSLSLAGALALGGCDRKQPTGLQPADDWAGAPHAGGSAATPPSDEPAMPVPGGGIGPLAPRGGLAADEDDPHGGGGGAEGDDPHAGMDVDPAAAPGANPHAGLDMDPAAAPGAANPHGGMLGNEVVDPNHVVRGVIQLGAATAGKAKPGTAVFVTAKHPDAHGQPTGTLLGVQRVDWPAAGAAAFTIEGDALEGEVVVTAHYDQDGEVRSTDPGNLLGQARVTVPSDKLVITLDTVAP